MRHRDALRHTGRTRSEQHVRKTIRIRVNRRRFDILDCLIVHRFGDLRPGDNIVLVVCLSAHRQAAFEAASFLMDFLKSRAPFWKKETDAAGEGAWVDARTGDVEASKRWDASQA